MAGCHMEQYNSKMLEELKIGGIQAPTHTKNLNTIAACTKTKQWLLLLS